MNDSVREVLEERARALARTGDTEGGASTETVSLVVLAVGVERYGVETERVQEIERLDGITSIPGTPGFWAGVVNLRGSMYPVLDIRSYLQLPGDDEAEDAKVALVTVNGVSVGLLVDEVLEIRRVPLDEIGPPVAEGAGGRHEVVRGVTPDMLTVLDLEALASDPTLVVDEGSA